jgi:predicted ATPase/DNA-binding winged helix-turn-helix (wHTH) protein
MTEQTFAFGSFRLDPNRRALREGGRLLHMGSRALDILIALVENAGETLTRAQLVERVWPNTVVGDASLRVHVAGLRKALADGQDGHRFIVNIPGRGYTFVASVVRQQTAEPPPVEAAIESRGNMPTSLTRVIGREGAINALLERQTRNRLVTIVGPGGIGKTTVAIAVATAAAPQYVHGAWFVSLASLADPALVPAAVASSLGASVSNVDAMLALTGWLRDRNALIVLDSCEHVIGAAAALAEAILGAAPRVRILATSREGLNAQTEWRYRLAPLAVPPVGQSISVDDALNYSAFNLFYQRVVATQHDISITDDEVAAAVEICRRLDGVPLALELAASSVELFGLRALARGLDDRFSVLTVGRRTALPRHRTLRATMDWSYALLTPNERTILCRLAVFLGDFTMDDAAAVAGDATIRAADVYEGIASLGAKSLLTTDISGDTTYLESAEFSAIFWQPVTYAHSRRATAR